MRRKTKEKRQQTSIQEELKEWFGITRAGGLMYLSFAIAIAAMALRDNIIIVASLFSIAILLSVYSAVLGVKKNNQVSLFTNIAKAVSYPVCVGLILLLVLMKIVIMLFE